MKKNMIVTVRGDAHEWTFPFKGDEQYFEEWRGDGLDVNIVEARIPQWVATLGLSYVWFSAQRCWQWLRVW